MLLPTPDYFQKGLKILLSQFKTAKNILTFLETLSDEIENIDDTVRDVYESKDLKNAVHNALDSIGNFVSLNRGGQPDPFYRRMLMAKIKAAASNGAASEIIDMIETLLPGSLSQYQLHPPATFILTYAAIPSEFVKNLVKRLIEEAAPAGVNFNIAQFDIDYFGFLDDPHAKPFTQGYLGTFI